MFPLWKFNQLGNQSADHCSIIIDLCRSHRSLWQSWCVSRSAWRRVVNEIFDILTPAIMYEDNAAAAKMLTGCQHKKIRHAMIKAANILVMIRQGKIVSEHSQRRRKKPTSPSPNEIFSRRSFSQITCVLTISTYFNTFIFLKLNTLN